jgi:hypothetical protein
MTGRLRAGVGFLMQVLSRERELPYYGDSDDARGFLLSAKDTPVDVILDLASRIFDEPAFFTACAGETVAGQVLLPELPPRRGVQPLSDSGAHIYEHGGLAVLNGDACKLIMDFGPLGYPSTAAHGHADSLSLLLALDGRYLLVDSGTYAYHSNPAWRTYFRGTAAHNTVRVDGVNQSVMTGRFLWGERAESKLLLFQETAGTWSIEAEHDGYRRLTDPVIHRRRVDCAKDSINLRVEDVLECRGLHEIEILWHLHESADVVQRGQSALVRFQGREIQFETGNHGFSLDIVCGREAPILGWRSPSFNVRLPAPTLRFSGRVNGASRIVTTITEVF